MVRNVLANAVADTLALSASAADMGTTGLSDC